MKFFHSHEIMIEWLRTYSLSMKVRGSEGFELSRLHPKLVDYMGEVSLGV
jgi:hypothetical protein